MNRTCSSVLSRSLALIVLASAACGTAADERPGEDATFQEAPVPEAAQPEPAVAAANPGPALAPADVDLYERGLRRELEALRSAEQRLGTAESANDTLRILGEVQPSELRRVGARAAGVPEVRYEQIKTAVNDVLGKQQMGGAMQGMMPSAEDTLAMTPEQRERVRENIRQMEAAWGDPYGGLSPETAETLRARSEQLGQLRSEYLAALMNLGR